MRGAWRGPRDEHAGALAAALQLLPRRPGAVVPAVAGAVVVVVQRVGRWRQQRRLRRHMGARREPLQILFFIFKKSVLLEPIQSIEAVSWLLVSTPRTAAAHDVMRSWQSCSYKN